MHRENQWNNNTRFSPHFQSGLSNTLHLTTTDSITLLRPAPPYYPNRFRQNTILPLKAISIPKNLYNNRGKGGKQFAHTVVIIYNDKEIRKRKKRLKNFYQCNLIASQSGCCPIYSHDGVKVTRVGIVGHVPEVNRVLNNGFSHGQQ